MFRTSKSRSGLYLPVIMYFMLKKGVKLGSQLNCIHVAFEVLVEQEIRLQKKSNLIAVLNDFFKLSTCLHYI